MTITLQTSATTTSVCGSCGGVYDRHYRVGVLLRRPWWQLGQPLKVFSGRQPHRQHFGPPQRRPQRAAHEKVHVKVKLESTLTLILYGGTSFLLPAEAQNTITIRMRPVNRSFDLTFRLARKCA